MATGWIAGGSPFLPTDSSHDFSQPYTADGTYDLAMSLEAVDTLPPDAAAPFVRALTAAAPVVLFSASAPHQPGLNHINCQWPAYSAKLFGERGYLVIDTLRYIIWDDDRVDWWYRQNIMIYVARDLIGRWPKLEAMYREGEQPLRLVQPELMRIWRDWGMYEEQRYWDLRAQMEKRESGTSTAS